MIQNLITMFRTAAVQFQNLRDFYRCFGDIQYAIFEGAFMTIYIYRAPRATSSHFISPSVDLPHSQSQFKDENVKEKQQHIHSMILW